MNPTNNPKVNKPVHARTERRQRQERRSFSESFEDRTSKFFSLIVAKKNGFFSDISSRIDTTFALKSDISSNSSGSDKSITPPSSPRCTSNRTPSPPRLNKGPSVKESGIKSMKERRMPSSPAYFMSNNKPELRRSIPLRNRSLSSNKEEIPPLERFSVNGMYVSFDEPIYSGPELNSSLPVTNISVTDTISCGSRTPQTRNTSGSYPSTSHTKPEAASHKGEITSKNFSTISRTRNCSHVGNYKSKNYGNSIGRDSDQPKSTCTIFETQKPVFEGKNIDADKMAQHLENNNKYVKGTNNYGEFDKICINTKTKSADICKTCPDKVMGETGKKHAHKSTRTKLRSKTVDEILFDDYITPEVDVINPKENIINPKENIINPKENIINPKENLINPKENITTPKEKSKEKPKVNLNEKLQSFEPDLKVQQKINTVSSTSECKALPISSADSSNVDYGSVVVHRTASFGSEKSWNSVYSVDSQPDEVTVECMDFMKIFVDKVFHCSEDISQTEKAKFGELCQHFAGRLWFSRYVSSQRVHHKKVQEAVFFSLMQYFAVCLFECYEADDFSPAKTLMNMCFTFNLDERAENTFLYTCLREQPIWRSLRFWNAAFFDAVQCERSRRPMPTNSDESETVSDDKQFQENITFGQLGTFVCNMREFGLSKELCLEFLRKQSTIANLGKEQVNLLRENIERVKDT